MALDKKTVAQIAHLARIEIAESELEPLAAELSNILTWIEKLNEVDIDGIEPMTSVVEMGLRWRDDVVTDGDRVDDVLANAPETERDHFLVPKVID